MTAITDQQRQDDTIPTADVLKALQNIEECAAELLSTDLQGVNALALEMIEGLAQAVRQLYIQQAQGWAPVMEDKR